MRVGKGIYSIYDSVADELGPIMVYNTVEQAQRAFPTAFKDHTHLAIADFKLLFLGYIETNIKILSYDEKAITAIVPEDVTPYIAINEKEK